MRRGRRRVAVPGTGEVRTGGPGAVLRPGRAGRGRGEADEGAPVRGAARRVRQRQVLAPASRSAAPAGDRRGRSGLRRRAPPDHAGRAARGHARTAAGPGAGRTAPRGRGGPVRGDLHALPGPRRTLAVRRPVARRPGSRRRTARGHRGGRHLPRPVRGTPRPCRGTAAHRLDGDPHDADRTAGRGRQTGHGGRPAGGARADGAHRRGGPRPARRAADALPRPAGDLAPTAQRSADAGRLRGGGRRPRGDRHGGRGGVRLPVPRPDGHRRAAPAGTRRPRRRHPRRQTPGPARRSARMAGPRGARRPRTARPRPARHGGRGERGTRPRGPDHRLAPAAGMDRGEPRTAAPAPAPHRGRPHLAGARPRSR